MQPGHANGIAFLKTDDARPDGGNDTGTFVTRNEGRCRLHRPVASSRVKVRVADPRRVDLDENLSDSRFGDEHFLNFERFSEFTDHRCLHCFRHDLILRMAGLMTTSLVDM